MKKTIFMSMAALALVVASCKNNSEAATEATDSTMADTTATEQVTESEPAAEASVVGTWKLSDMDLGMEIPKGKEKAFEDMKKKMIDATVYTFNEDGTMSFKNAMVKETAGTYTYADSKITITDAKTKKEETVTVDSLTADKLVLTSEQNGKKAVMTFTK